MKYELIFTRKYQKFHKESWKILKKSHKYFRQGKRRFFQKLILNFAAIDDVVKLRFVLTPWKVLNIFDNLCIDIHTNLVHRDYFNWYTMI